MLKKCDERTNVRTNEQTDLYIELRYAQLINTNLYNIILYSVSIDTNNEGKGRPYQKGKLLFELVV